MGPAVIAVGTAATAALGILGSVTTLRGPGGRIRPQAKWLFLAIGASSLLSLVGGFMASAEGDDDAERRQTRILQQIWRDGNRIDAVAVSLQLELSPTMDLAEIVKSPGLPSPLLQENWDATVLVAPAGAKVPRDRGRFHFNNPGTFRDPEFGWTSRLDAKTQITKISTRPSVDGPSWSQITIYGQFVGNTEKFTEPTEWNGASVKVHISARHPEDVNDEPFTSIVDTNRDLVAAGFPSLSELQDTDSAVFLLPFSAKMTLLLRGRPIATAEKRLVRTTGHDEDVEHPLVLDFPIVQVAPTTFGSSPGSSAGGEPLVSIVLSLLALLLAGTIVLAYWLYLRTRRAVGTKVDARRSAGETGSPPPSRPRNP